MGLKFIVDGKAFYVNGWNSYWLMYRAMEEFSRPRVRTMLQAGAKMGLTVCRTWAFNDGTHHALQISPGRFDNHVFKKDKMGAKYGRSVDFIPPSHQQSCERSRYDLTGQSLYLPPLVGKNKNPSEGKLGPNWQGPFKVVSVTGQSAYRLEDMNGKELPRPWNAAHLKNSANGTSCPGSVVEPAFPSARLTEPAAQVRLWNQPSLSSVNGTSCPGSVVEPASPQFG
ncbi:mannan endo-1,4-beta-mannosidase 2 isoform X2 [Cinnamomum micranthum f. kanehirae]|uniref:Mannan endo-1,4-beta-mannosidase 2 isoform X2 n=1 Tax=Cinnamomum micranthum f. kanehirae TaxID=337451 RepID=A0A3S3MPE9_9MAGN|nr:mannan endo-1,4-beta-mannosidase 2 isoform X2 [Cinnamomum micranthum f. kanehirae]